MPSYWIIIVVIFSYLIGAIPFGALISLKIAKIDITKRGSGNIGATNVAREVGLSLGLITLLLDLMKGFVPAYIFSRYFNTASYFEMGLSVVSMSTLLGHQFSIFRRLHGGKGVATALGVFLAISPVPAIITLSLFIIAVYISDYVSMGSLLASAAMPPVLLVCGYPKIIIFTSLLMAIMIFLKHRDNIQRLLNRDERRWRKGTS